ncbi:MAG: hypothetical protein U0930_12155 [Pirellulales bacterium]
MENHLETLFVREYDAGENTAQEVRMIRAFADQVLSDCQRTVAAVDLATQRVLDACFESSKTAATGQL